MTNTETNTILDKLQDILERHIGARITPELGTGILTTMNKEIGLLAVAPSTKQTTKKPTKAGGN